MSFRYIGCQKLSSSDIVVDNRATIQTADIQSLILQGELFTDDQIRTLIRHSHNSVEFYATGANNGV